MKGSREASHDAFRRWVIPTGLCDPQLTTVVRRLSRSSRRKPKPDLAPSLMPDLAPRPTAHENRTRITLSSLEFSGIFMDKFRSEETDLSQNGCSLSRANSISRTLRGEVDAAYLHCEKLPCGQPFYGSSQRSMHPFYTTVLFPSNFGAKTTQTLSSELFVFCNHFSIHS
jgi:hypothetical protein